MENQIREFTKKGNRRRLFKRVVSLLCVVVLLFTMNTLKRNANTLERIAMCGLQEHTHTAGCYNSSGELVCAIPEHVHTDACYQQSPSDDLVLNGDDLEIADGLVDAGDTQSLDLSLDLDQGGLLDFVQDAGAPASNVQDIGNDMPVLDGDLVFDTSYNNEETQQLAANTSVEEAQGAVDETQSEEAHQLLEEEQIAVEDGQDQPTGEGPEQISFEEDQEQPVEQPTEAAQKQPVEEETEQPVEGEQLVEEDQDQIAIEEQPVVAEQEQPVEEVQEQLVIEEQEEPVVEAQEEPVVEEQEEPVVEEQEEPVIEEQEEPVVEEQEEPAVEEQEETVVEEQEEPAVEEQEEPVVEEQEEPAVEEQEEPVVEEQEEPVVEEQEEPAVEEQEEPVVEEQEEPVVEEQEEPVVEEQEETVVEEQEEPAIEEQEEPVVEEQEEPVVEEQEEPAIEEQEEPVVEEQEEPVVEEQEEPVVEEQEEPVVEEQEEPAVEEQEEPAIEEQEEPAVEEQEELAVEEQEGPAVEEQEEPAVEEQEEPAVEEQEEPAVEEQEQPAIEEQEEPAEEAEQPAEEEAEQPAEEEAEQPAEEEAEQPAEEEAEQPTEEEAEQPTEEEAEQPAEENAEQPAEEEAEQPTEEEAEQPTEEEAEQPAEEEQEQPAEEEQEQPAEEEAEQPTEEEAEQPTEEEAEQPAEENAEQPAEEEAEQPAEEEAEQPTEEEAEQPAEEEAEQPTEEEAEQPAEEEQEQPAEVESDPEAEGESEEEPEAQIAYPAKQFQQGTAYINVSVDAPEGAFPEGTVMVVKDVEDQGTIDNIQQSVAEDFVEVTSVHAVDISFWYNDAEIEPLLPIAVVMSAVEAPNADHETVVVHVDDNGETQLVDSEATGAAEAALEMPAAADAEAQAFEADTFSVYALVTKQTIETKYIDDHGDTWRIKVDYGRDAKLPEGASLQVAEVTDETYLAQAEAALESGKRITKARFFDIRIMDGDREVQPDDQVKVTVTLEGDEGEIEATDNQNDIGNPDVVAMHFVEQDDEIVSVETKSAVETDEGVVFNADGFSTWGVIYTVDFHYAGQTEHIEGGSQILLSELIEKLNILDLYGDPLTMDQVENVIFSDETLLTVEKVSGEVEVNGETVTVEDYDFLLTSKESFDTYENLEIYLYNGDVIRIGVSDASEVAANDGIKSLVTGVTIDAKFDGTNYIFYPNQPYGIHINFAEVNKANGQFPMSGSFTYQLPSGFIPSGASASNRLPITLSGGDHAGEKVYLNFTINDSGLVTFTWDETTNPEGFAQLRDALYTKFHLDIECIYGGTTGDLNFGNEVVKKAEVRTNGHINLGKKGTYNPATNCVDYEVTVNSDGITQNIVVQDTVTGTALTYKKDATATSSLGNAVPTPNSTDTGFSLTIPRMADGETISIKYSAAVNLGGVTDNGQGSLGTVVETNNKVKVTGGNPDVEIEKSGKDFENKISLSNIGKSGEALETDENGHATVNWTIHANDYANVSMAGHTISDSIDGNSVPMTYNGDGIYVTAYRENGEAACVNYFIPWTDSNMEKTDTSWVWHVPNDSFNQQKLSYVITYTTDADVSGRIIKTNVKNTTGSDIGGSASAGVDVTPPGGGLTARKKVIKTDITSKTVTWEVSFDVPENGLDSARIRDTVPNYFKNGQTVAYAVDSYIDGTVTISPELAGGESYAVTTEGPDASGKEYVVIDFYKTANQQVVTGLSGTGSKRKIRVQFQTEIDDAWVQEAVDHPTDSNALYHTNNADVILNGQTITVSATTRIDGNQPGMNKVHGAQDTYQINGNTLPAFPYTIVLTGVSDDSFDDQGNLILEDTFNSKYLAFYPSSQDGKGDNSKVGHIFASTDYRTNPIWNNNAVSDASVVTSPSAGKILVNITRENIPMNGDSYYPYYYVYYYLTVKDPIALEKLEQAIQTSENGVYELLNKVSNNYFGTVTDTASYEIPVIDKSILKHGDQNAYYQNGNYMVDFELDINPNALTLGDEEELTLIDDYTNLALDYTTIRIVKVDRNGLETPVTDADGVTWDRKGNRITAILKNSEHYKIYYSARITGEANNEGKVNYSNTVEFFGVKDWEDQWQNVTTGGDGTSPTYGITVFKHVKGNASKPLPGTRFKLYKYDAAEDEDSWQNRPEATTALEQPGWTYVKDLVTDANGVAKTQSTDQIQRWTWYKLIETEAPTVDGQAYQKKDFAYVFWITKNGQADYEHYVYLNDDVVAIDNEPVLPDYVDLGVTKTWTNDNGDKTKRRDITVRLYADGVPYNLATDSEGNPLAPREDTVRVLHLNSDGTTESYTWNGLPGGPVYSVVEDGVPGYTTTYSSKGTQVSGNINIKNKYIPGKTFIHVEKDWSEEIPVSARADDITVQLKRKVSANAEIRVVSNTGTMREHFPVPVGSVVNIDFAGTVPTEYEYRAAPYTEANNWQGELYIGYKDGTRPAWELYSGNTTATSALIDSGTADSSVTTEYGHVVHITGVTVGVEGLTLRFPDDYGQGGYDPNLHLSQTPQVTVVGGSGAATYSDDVDFNNENRYYTLSASNGWKLDIDRLVKEDADGKYIYYIEEVGVNDNTETPAEAGYRVTYTNNAGIEGGTGNTAADTVTVTNAPLTVDAEFHKTWTNTVTEAAGANTMDNTAKLRVVIQLERWYRDIDGAEKKDADLYDPITLFGDTSTYQSKGYTDKYSETSSAGDLSGKLEALPKKGRVNGETVEYIYKIVEKRVFLASDAGETDLLKAGVYSVAETTNKSADVYNSTANNTFPVANIDVTKDWKKENEDGSITDITPDAGVTVTVQLQRRWRDISSNYDYTGTMTVGDWSAYENVAGKTLTLTSDDWTGAFAGLPVYGTREEQAAPNGFSIVEYDYRVAETGVTINGKPVDKHYTTAIDVTNVGHNDKSVTITNTETEPQTGSLKLTKLVTVNANAPSASQYALVDGDYTFTVTKPDEADDVVATVVIKVENGVATQYKLNGATSFTNLPSDKYVVISELDEGDYVITEAEVSGMTTKVSGGKESLDNSLARTITVHVTAGVDEPATAATATFTNDKPYIEANIPGTKVLENDVLTAKQFSFTIASDSSNPSAPMPVTKTVSNVADGSFSFGPIAYELSDLGNENSKAFKYTISEQAGNESDIVYDNQAIKVTVTVTKGNDGKLSAVVDKDANAVKFTNKRVTSLPVEKTWKKADGTADTVTNSTVKEVTFTLYYQTKQVADASGNAVTGEPTPNTPVAYTGADVTNKTVTVTYNTDDTKSWKGAFEGLPKYLVTEQGKFEYIWTAKETKIVIENGTENGIILDTDEEIAEYYQATGNLTTTEGKVIVDNRKRPTEHTVSKTWNLNGVELPTVQYKKLNVTYVLHQSINTGSDYVETSFSDEKTVSFTDLTAVDSGCTWENLEKWGTATINEHSYTGAFKYWATESKVELEYTKDGQTVKADITDLFEASNTGDNATVTEGVQTITNTQKVKKAKVVKVWEKWDVSKNNYETVNTGVAVEFKLIQTYNGAPHVYGTITLDGTTDDRETTAWQYQWPNLPAYVVDGSNVYDATYSVEEVVSADAAFTQYSMTNAPDATDTQLTVFTAVNRYTGFEVEKHWVSPDGTNALKDGVSITLRLNREKYASNGERVVGSENEVDTVTFTYSESDKTVTRKHGTDGDVVVQATDPDAWKFSWDMLPVSVTENETTYTYKYVVKEDALDGYNTAYAVNGQTGAIPAIGGGEVVTNTKFSTVSLPATGGMGTGVVYGAGAALLLLAVLGLILLNRKRTDGEGIR